MSIHKGSSVLSHLFHPLFILSFIPFNLAIRSPSLLPLCYPLGIPLYTSSLGLRYILHTLPLLLLSLYPYLADLLLP